MAQPAIRGIIFDIGRVLVRVDIRRAQVGLAQGLSLSPDELWSAIEKDPRWNDWQNGRISARDWHHNLSTRLGIPLSFDQFTTVWNSALVPEPIHSIRLFEILARNYKLGLLSNTDTIHVARLEASYDFFHFFPPAVRTYSCSLGASKPEPLIYREALRATKLKAQEAVYVDDIPAYVEAAQKLGLTGIRFQSPDQLYGELRALGIDLKNL